MPKNQTHEIPQEGLRSLIQGATMHMNDRIARLRLLESHLATQGLKTLIWAKAFKISIVFLGAIIATRVIADNIWQKYHSGQETHIVIIVSYTILSVAIAIFGGLDGTFKFGELASEISFLKVRCSVTIDAVEDDWLVHVQQPGISQEALDSIGLLLKRLGQTIAEIEQRLSQLSVSLPASPIRQPKLSSTGPQKIAVQPEQNPSK